MSETADLLNREVHSVAPKGHDLEMHLSEVTAPDGSSWYELRDFVPSRQTYMRGLTVPMDTVTPLIEMLTNLQTTKKSRRRNTNA